MSEPGPPVTISLAKCWQTDDGALVFQCAIRTNAADDRRKGFLIIAPSDRADVVRFVTEKPSKELTANGLAALVRKHCSTAQLVSIALSQDSHDRHFIRLKLRSSQSHQDVFIIATIKPKAEIDFVVDGFSLGRLQPKASFSVRKKALPEYLAPQETDAMGFLAWINALIEPAGGSSHGVPDLIAPTLTSFRREARDKIARRLKTLRKTLDQDLKKVPSDGEIQSAKRQSQLLKSYLWLVKPGMFALNLDSTQTGEKPSSIEIVPELSPGENLERMFQKIKKLERAHLLQGERIVKLQQQISTFEDALARIKDQRIHLAENDVTEILVALRLKQAKNKLPTRTKVAPKKQLGRRFLSRTGAYITLGRDSVESDKLVKAAKSNDWWIHIAGGGHGGHVIISGIPNKTPLPENALRDGAILALHFSDRSASREGEVYCTKRQFIRKPKGLAPGLWIVDKSNTFMVRYEPGELADVFSREVRDGISRHQE